MANTNFSTYSSFHINEPQTKNGNPFLDAARYVWIMWSISMQTAVKLTTTSD
jgi:hypothetical protein